MRLFKRLLPFLLVAAITTTGLESCWMFRGKNGCGDCPSFKSNNKPKKVKRKKHH